jgi:hypothetical protein
MHRLWLGIAVATALPLAFVGFPLIPLVYVALGSGRWHERMEALWPHRWRLGFDVAMFVVSG